jgi:hypothetical protein
VNISGAAQGRRCYENVVDATIIETLDKSGFNDALDK